MAYKSLCEALTEISGKILDPINIVVSKGIAIDGFWDENKHPRNHGKFTKKESANTTSEAEKVRDEMGAGDHPEFQRVTDNDRLAIHNAIQKANSEVNAAKEKIDSSENMRLGRRDAVYKHQRAQEKLNHLLRIQNRLQKVDASGEIARRHHLDWEHEKKNGAYSDWIAGARGAWEGNNSGRQPMQTVWGKEYKTHSAKNAGVSAAKREFNAQLSAIKTGSVKMPSVAPRRPYAPYAAPTYSCYVRRVNEDGTTTPVREVHEITRKQRMRSIWNKQPVGWRIDVASMPKPNLPK